MASTQTPTATTKFPQLPGFPPRPELPERTLMTANPKYYNPLDFEDVTSLKEDELEKSDPMVISKYCESLIRSRVNSPTILEKWLSKANLDYVDSNNNNLLVIAILSNNFKPIDILLKLGCPRNVKNNSHGYSADDLSGFPSCHKTVKEIFKKYTVVKNKDE